MPAEQNWGKETEASDCSSSLVVNGDDEAHALPATQFVLVVSLVKQLLLPTCSHALLILLHHLSFGSFILPLLLLSVLCPSSSFTLFSRLINSLRRTGSLLLLQQKQVGIISGHPLALFIHSSMK